MSGLVLDFHGGSESLPIWMLLIGVSLVLCTWGVVGIFRRRWVSSAGLLFPGILVIVAAFYPGAKIPVLVIQLVAVVVGVYVQTYSALGAKKWTSLLVLRLAAILVLLLILLKPAIVLSPGDDARGLLAIAVDRSASMGTDDEPSLPDRYTQSVRMLQSQRERMEKNFRTRWFDFAASAQKLDSPDKLATISPSDPGSGETNIAAALDTIKNTLKPDGLVGVILVSDGINNGPDPISAANQLGVPVYTLGVGSQLSRVAGSTNLQLLGVDAPMIAPANNVTEITVRLQATNLTDQPCKVQLFDGFSTVSPGSETVSPAKHYHPPTVGYKFLHTQQLGVAKKRPVDISENDYVEHLEFFVAFR